MIRRAKRPDMGFLIVFNDVARDRRVSRRARGLLIEMLSYPDDWNFDRDWLAAQTEHEGQHAIRNALAELEQFGYLERRRVRLGGGRFGWEHIIYDTPQAVSPGQASGQKAPSGASQEPDVSPGHTTGRFSTDGAPTDGIPTGGKRPSYEGLSTNNCYEEEQPLASLAPPSRAEALPGMPEHPAAESPARRNVARPTAANAAASVMALFDEFYAAYPRKVGKEAARRAWASACRKANPQSIIAAAARYASDPNREPQFTAHPSTWLNQGRWADEEPLPARTNGHPSGAQARADRIAAFAHESRAEAMRSADPFALDGSWREITDGTR